MSSYYESEDVNKFCDIGQHTKTMAKDFFKYYGDATDLDGVLIRRQEALIAPAIRSQAL